MQAPQPDTPDAAPPPAWPEDRHRLAVARRRGSLRAALSRLEAAVGAHSGIITRVTDLPLTPGEPAFFHVAAYLADLGRLARTRYFNPVAGAVNLDREEARLRALAEALEHYCGYLVAQPLWRAIPRDLAGRCLEVERWPRCSSEEYQSPHCPVSPPDPDRPYDWVLGRRWPGGDPLYVPAAMVYLSYFPDAAEEYFAIPLSTGLAAGPTFEAALAAGICEAVERDAFLLTWFGRLSAPRLNLEISDPTITERLRRLARAGLEVRCHALLPEQGIPAVLTLLLGPPWGKIPVVVAASAAPHGVRALSHSLDEAVQVYAHVVRDVVTHGDPPRPERPENVRSLSDHVSFYLHRDRLEAFDFLLRRPADELALHELPAAPGDLDPADELPWLCERLRDMGEELIAVDLTTPDVGTLGLRVVRAVVPGLVPLSPDHNVRYLGMPRVRRYVADPSPWPHPFA